MQKLIFLFLLLAFAACDKSKLEGNRPACIQTKIDDFIGDEHSRSVQWMEFQGETVYKFRSVIGDDYLNDGCDTICQYSPISCAIPTCMTEMENAANWEIIWEK